MGVYFRTSRSTGVGVPWIVAPFALLIWLYCAFIVLVIRALVIVVVAAFAALVWLAPYAWKALWWMGWAWVWLAGYGYGWALVGVRRGRQWWAARHGA